MKPLNNRIEFCLKVLKEGDITELDGIEFSNIAYVVAYVDERNMYDLNAFEGSFIVANELKKSTLKSGEYLIFTSVSGIADDAGWDLICVNHDENEINWSVNRNNETLTYTFDKDSYLDSIFQLNKSIEKLDDQIALEPTHIIYPEE